MGEPLWRTLELINIDLERNRRNRDGANYQGNDFCKRVIQRWINETSPNFIYGDISTHNKHLMRVEARRRARNMPNIVVDYHRGTRRQPQEGDITLQDTRNVFIEALELAIQEHDYPWIEFYDCCIAGLSYLILLSGNPYEIFDIDDPNIQRISNEAVERRDNYPNFDPLIDDDDDDDNPMMIENI
jgi:hypothetical protein